jgi:hypothetical protein
VSVLVAAGEMALGSRSWSLLGCYLRRELAAGAAREEPNFAAARGVPSKRSPGLV